MGLRFRPSARRMRQTLSRFSCGRKWRTVKVGSSKAKFVARRRAQTTALLVKSFPRQFRRQAVWPRRAVQAVGGAPRTPLADGFRDDAGAPGRAGDPGANDRRGAGVRIDVQHASPLPWRGGRQGSEPAGVLHDSQPDRVATMLRNQTATPMLYSQHTFRPEQATGRTRLVACSSHQAALSVELRMTPTGFVGSYTSIKPRSLSSKDPTVFTITSPNGHTIVPAARKLV